MQDASQTDAPVGILAAASRAAEPGARKTVACPSCDTVYRVPRDKRDAARLMRCGQCGYAWSPQAEAPVLDLHPEDSVAPGELDDAVGDENVAADIGEGLGPVEDGTKETCEAPVEDEPRVDHDTEDASEPVDLDDPDFAARSLLKRRARRVTPMAARIAAGLVLALGLLGSGAALHAREAVVAFQPRTASLFEAIGLPVNLTPYRIAADGARLAAFDETRHLTLTVTLANAAPTPLAMPALDLTLLDEAGLSLGRHALRVPSGQLMGLGETSFEARIDLDHTMDPAGVANAVVALAPRTTTGPGPVLSMIDMEGGR